MICFVLTSINVPLLFDEVSASLDVKIYTGHLILNSELFFYSIWMEILSLHWRATEIHFFCSSLLYLSPSVARGCLNLEYSDKMAHGVDFKAHQKELLKSCWLHDHTGALSDRLQHRGTNSGACWQQHWERKSHLGLNLWTISDIHYYSIKHVLFTPSTLFLSTYNFWLRNMKYIAGFIQ